MMKASRPPKDRADVVWRRTDFRLASALKEATPAPDVPSALYRPVPWRASAAALGGALLLVLAGAWGFLTYVLPPPLVREAMIHENREATLRGDFQADKRPMLAAMGLEAAANLPGLVQLQRPCDVDGQVAFHVTTFLERGGGMVTIMAFREPLASLRPGERGSWFGRHWRVADGLPGRTVLLLSDNPRALETTERLLRSG